MDWNLLYYVLAGGLMLFYAIELHGSKDRFWSVLSVVCCFSTIAIVTMVVNV